MVRHCPALGRICSRDTWPREVGNTPRPRLGRSLAELSAKSLASSVLQRGSGMVRLLEAKTGVSWQGGGIDAGAGNTMLGCLCNQRFLLLPFRRAKLHQTIW